MSKVRARWRKARLPVLFAVVALALVVLAAALVNLVAPPVIDTRMGETHIYFAADQRILLFPLIQAAIGDLVPGWASVIVVLLVTSGVQLISIGVLAQYIGMIFEQVKNRPLYTLKQKRLASQQPPEEE